ncbi:MAG: class I SAM-dependent methyltransferase [Alphaproteobacteria bacterium]
MSRLDSFIRRMIAQRDCLALVAEMIGNVPGPVIEFGLGNGRTYDHLRELLPGREIFVFDRQVAAHPDCIPDDAHMILGDIPASLDGALARIIAPAALAHSDIGSGDTAANGVLAESLGAALDGLMAPGGIVISDQLFHVPGWSPVALPPEVAAGRYFISRVGERES